MQHRLEQHTTWLENHDANLFFDRDEVSGIIDWDKAELRSRGEEVLRAMHLSLRLDVPRCRAFLTAYRTVAALQTTELHRAAVVYTHDRACDLWLYVSVTWNHPPS